MRNLHAGPHVRAGSGASSRAGEIVRCTGSSTLRTASRTPPVGAGALRAGPSGGIVLLLFLSSGCGAEVAGGDERDGVEDEVLAVVETLFQAMADRDPDLVGEVLFADGQFVVVQVAPDGAIRTRVSSHEDFVGLIAAADRPIIERFWDPEVRVHGPLAMVWTPYDLFRGDEFSHCGVDVFTLVRTDEGWKISGGSYTIEPENCPPPPEGPLEPGRIGGSR
jgi:hypothetical protein